MVLLARFTAPRESAVAVAHAAPVSDTVKVTLCMVSVPVVPMVLAPDMLTVVDDMLPVSVEVKQLAPPPTAVRRLWFILETISDPVPIVTVTLQPLEKDSPTILTAALLGVAPDSPMTIFVAPVAVPCRTTAPRIHGLKVRLEPLKEVAAMDSAEEHPAAVSVTTTVEAVMAALLSSRLLLPIRLMTAD
jgi:hypothetical protein